MDTKSREWILFFTMFFIAGAVLMSEILAMRAATLAFGARYEFFIIPLTLLGMGVGAALVSRVTIRSKRAELLYVALAYPVCTLLPFIIAYSAHAIELPVVLHAAFFISGFISYAMAGWIIAAILMRRSESVSWLYFFDLVGAACGVVCTILVLDLFGFGAAISAMFVVSLVPAVLLSVYFFSHVWFLKGFLLAFLTTIILYLYVFAPPSISCGTSTVFFKSSNSYSEVELKRGKYDSGVQVLTDIPRELIPPSVSIFNIGIDCNSVTTMRLAFNSWQDVEFMDLGLRSIPFAFLRAVGEAPDSALILGSGGGIDVIRARHFGVPSIDATELNPLVAEAAYSLPNYSINPYEEAGVRLHVTDSRRFISTTMKSYDLILSARDIRYGTDPFAGVVTNYTATAEARQLYLEHLRPYGIYADILVTNSGHEEVPTWVLQSLQRAGLHATDRVAIVSGNDQVGDLLLVRKEPFTADEKEILAGEANKRGYPKITYVTDNKITEAQQMHTQQGATDDNPLLIHFGTGSEAHELRNNPSRVTYNLLLALGLACGVLCVVVWLGKRILPLTPSRLLASASYFSAVGFGLICFEIALIQKFALVLADPSYSIAVTLFSILFFGGLGSLFLMFLPRKKLVRTITILGAGFLTSIMLLVLFGSVISDTLIPYALFPRMLGIVSMLIIPSFLAGMFFPLGVEQVRELGQKMVPWAWGVGGIAGVVGGLAGKILLLEYGITATLCAVMFAYMVAWISLLLLYLNKEPYRS